LKRLKNIVACVAGTGIKRNTLAISKNVSPYDPSARRFSMEESVAEKPNEVQMSFLMLRVFARGRVAFMIGAGITMLLLALAVKILLR
jgi:hypothetical protein